MKDWAASVDIYCERLGPGLWAEPLNAASNLGFVLAGIWLLLGSLRRGDPFSIKTLPVLLILIGLGSAAFHTVANEATQLLDVAFIGVYIYWFVACYARHRWGLPWWACLVGVALFHGFSLAVTKAFAPGALNGSVAYLPALFGLLIFGVLSAMKDRLPRAGWFFAAAAVFVVSLTLRTLDMSLCARWPLGTHWAWHLLNALTLTLTTLAISRSPGIVRTRI